MILWELTGSIDYEWQTRKPRGLIASRTHGRLRCLWPSRECGPWMFTAHQCSLTIRLNLQSADALYMRVFSVFVTLKKKHPAVVTIWLRPSPLSFLFFGFFFGNLFFAGYGPDMMSFLPKRHGIMEAFRSSLNHSAVRVSSQGVTQPGTFLPLSSFLSLWCGSSFTLSHMDAADILLLSWLLCVKCSRHLNLYLHE